MSAKDMQKASITALNGTCSGGTEGVGNDARVSEERPSSHAAPSCPVPDPLISQPKEEGAGHDYRGDAAAVPRLSLQAGLMMCI